MAIMKGIREYGTNGNGDSDGISLRAAAMAYAGKWRDLRYSTGSVSDLSVNHDAY
jgi:hypothetical protein